MTVHPTIENMGCNLCLVIMQSRSEKPVLSSNIMSLFPNSGHENKHYLQFSTTISCTESTSYLFVDFFFFVVCGVFLCFFLFSHTSRAFDTSVTGLNSCFLQHFHRVFFADFFRVQLCVVVRMTCYTIAHFSTEVNELSTVNRAGRDYWTPLPCTCSPSSLPSKHKWKTHHKTQSTCSFLSETIFIQTFTGKPEDNIAVRCLRGFRFASYQYHPARLALQDHADTVLSVARGRGSQTCWTGLILS